MDLYSGEKEDMMKDGVLTKCHLALSRQPGVPKVRSERDIQRGGRGV